MYINREHEQILREQARFVRENRGVKPFGTGDCYSGTCFLDAQSLRLENLDAYYDIDGQSITAAGQTAFTLTFDPAEAFVIPVAVSSTVIDSTDPQLDQMVFFTAVGVKGCQQELIHEPAPTAATTQFWPSTKWDPRSRNGCACPVSWAPYSNAGLNTRRLQISGFNPNPAGTTARIIVNVYGKPCDVLPTVCGGNGNGMPQQRPKYTPPGGGIPTGGGSSTGGGSTPSRGSAVPTTGRVFG